MFHHLGATRVLVVDDDPLHVELIRLILNECGITNTYGAKNGAAALAILANGIDLLICDLNMPEMNGIELLARIANLQCPPKIVLASGADTRILESARHFAQASRLTVLGTLVKPLNLNHLDDALLRFEAARLRHDIASPAISPTRLAHGIRDNAVNLEYQPKLDLVSGKVAGVEALLRWRDELGPASPKQVLDAAESSDIGERLTVSILQKAVSDRTLLAEQGFDVNIAVNMSLPELSRCGAVETLREIVEAQGCSPSNFTVEVTETYLVDDMSKALEAILRLRMHGFRISLDDYGTGTSTMQMLHMIPSSELKIDRSFLELTSQSKACVFLASAAALGLRLGQTVVAEGIETEAELQVARACGCHLGQGYLLARPMTREHLASWLSHREKGPALCTPERARDRFQ